MKKRKFLALTLACALGAGTMAGCGSDGGTQTGANADGAAVTGTETGTADSGEVVTLKWIQVGNGMPDNYDAWLSRSIRIWRKRSELMWIWRLCRGATGITDEA